MVWLCALLALLLPRATVLASGPEPVPVVVGVDLASHYFPVQLRKSEAPFALAALLHDPGVRVLAVAAGFARRDLGLVAGLLALHPCKAAERFLQEVGSAGVPLVCSAPAEGFLGSSDPSERLASLMGGGGERAVTWVALDSWSAAAAAVALGSKAGRFVREVVLPAPAAAARGKMRLDLPAGVPELITPRDFEAAAALRQWQEGAADEGAAPRLAIVWRADNSTRLPSLHGEHKRVKAKCPDSWVASRMPMGPISMPELSRFFEGFMATALTTGVVEWLWPRGVTELMLAREEAALAAAAHAHGRASGPPEEERLCASLPLQPAAGAEPPAPGSCGSVVGADAGRLPVVLLEAREMPMLDLVLQALCRVGAAPKGMEL